jgi:putative oxidoreductase
MKIAVIIVRTLVGLLLIMSSLTYFLNVAPPPPDLSGDTKTFFDGLTASKSLLSGIKIALDTKG